MERMQVIFGIIKIFTEKHSSICDQKARLSQELDYEISVVRQMDAYLSNTWETSPGNSAGGDTQTVRVSDSI